MSFVDRITPKDTEEVKPGLFIQKKHGSYHHIQPAAWDGKIIWKNFILGANPLRNFIFFTILMFIVYGYINDVDQYKQFYENVNGNPQGYCQSIKELQVNPDGGINIKFGEIEVNDESTNTIQSNN